MTTELQNKIISQIYNIRSVMLRIEKDIKYKFYSTTVLPHLITGFKHLNESIDKIDTDEKGLTWATSQFSALVDEKNDAFSKINDYPKKLPSAPPHSNSANDIKSNISHTTLEKIRKEFLDNSNFEFIKALAVTIIDPDERTQYSMFVIPELEHKFINTHIMDIRSMSDLIKMKETILMEIISTIQNAEKKTKCETHSQLTTFNKYCDLLKLNIAVWSQTNLPEDNKKIDEATEILNTKDPTSVMGFRILNEKIAYLIA